MTIRACAWWLAAALSGAALSGCGEPSRDAPPQFLFGRTGAGPGEFAYPRAGAYLDGELFVVDKTGRIQVFSDRGVYQRSWRVPETSAGKPTGLCVSADGRVFVADTHYARILVYDRQGVLLHSFGGFGTGPGQFRLPTDVAVDAAGNIYVSEYGGNDRICKFSRTYEFIMSFNGTATADRAADAPAFSRPQSLRIDADGTIWVADACNHRVCRFSPDGVLLSSFGSAGGERGELRFPYSIDRLSDGSIVVCEYGNNRIQRFSREGRSLGVWGEAGRKPGELAYPWAAVVGANDLIYVIDSGNNRIQAVAHRDLRK